MDQGCLGHIFLEANSHSVPKKNVSSFQPHINSMLNDRIRGHLFPYHLLLQTETYIKASITYRTHVTQARENNNKIARKLRQND